MGLPRFWGKVERVLERDVVSSRGKDDADYVKRSEVFKSLSAEKNGEASIGWTVVYYVLLVVGALGFWKGLWPLTESHNALAKV